MTREPRRAMSLSLRIGAMLLTWAAAAAEVPAPALSAANPPIPSYTLDDCLRIGLARATSVQNAARDEAIAAADVTQAKAQAYPGASVNAGYTRVDKVLEFSTPGGSAPMGQLDSYSAAVGVKQLLYSGGLLRAGIRAATIYKDYSALETARVRADLARTIRTSFYDILLARAAVDVRRESVQQLRGLAGEADLKYRSGTASEFDQLNARVRLSNEIPLLIAASNQLAVAKASFRALLNLQDPDFDLAGEPAYRPFTAPLGRLQSIAFTNRPEIRQMQAMVDILNLKVVAARAQYKPTLNALFTYTEGNPSPIDPSTAAWQGDWTAGLTASWEIMDGGRRHANVQQQLIQAEKAKANLKEIEKNVGLEIQQAYLDLQHAGQAVNASRDNIALAEKGMSIAQVRYKEGLST